MITGPGRHKRDELPQCEEREQRKKDDRANWTDHDGEGEDDGHHPPGVDPGVQVLDSRHCRLVAGSPLDQPADHGGDDQQGDQAAKQALEREVMKQVHAASFRARTA